MSAVISECGRYRYELRRQLLPLLASVIERKLVVWVMCNPSTADAVDNDHTISKCCGFTNKWQRHELLVVNAYAYRSTASKVLIETSADPFGDENQRYLESAFTEAGPNGLIVFAWGDALPKRLRQSTAARMTELVTKTGAKPMCLGWTKNNQPKHPLMLSYDTPLEPWAWRNNDGIPF